MDKMMDDFPNENQEHRQKARDINFQLPLFVPVDTNMFFVLTPLQVPALILMKTQGACHEKCAHSNSYFNDIYYDFLLHNLWA